LTDELKYAVLFLRNTKDKHLLVNRYIFSEHCTKYKKGVKEQEKGASLPAACFSSLPLKLKPACVFTV